MSSGSYSSERRYIDPWDVENYIYLRKGPSNPRRRSVCFDQAVKYASYEDDGFGPIYGSLVETNLKTSGSDYPDYQDDRSLYMYNSLPSPSSQCPSCFRDLNELDEFDMMGADVIYEDLMARTLMDRRKRRKKTSSTSSRGYPGPSVWEQNFGLNTLGHLRIDYSGNWNKLDSIIGHAC